MTTSGLEYDYERDLPDGEIEEPGPQVDTCIEFFPWIERKEGEPLH